METGIVDASSKEAAALLLQKYNIFVTSIKEQNPMILRHENIRLFSKISKKDLAIFSRQLAVMMQSRVPVTQSLKSLAVQTKNPEFREKILRYLSWLKREVNYRVGLVHFQKLLMFFILVY